MELCDGIVRARVRRRHFSNAVYDSCLRAKSLAFAMVCLALFGCEKTVTNPGWPEYKERLVCSANIYIDSTNTIIECNLGRTVPLNETLDFNTSRVNDAEIILTRNSESDTITNVPLSQGRYGYQNYFSVIRTNDATEYSLTCRSGLMTLVGSVTMPSELRTKLDTILTTPDTLWPNIRRTTFRLHVIPDFDYWFVFSNGQPSYPFDTHDSQPEGRSVDLVIYMPKGTYTYSITAKNKNFRDNFSSSSGNVFDPSGGNPLHNMTGDGMGFLTLDVTGPTYSFEVK